MIKFELSEEGNKCKTELLADIAAKSANKKVIYISGPATGVPNYKDKFNSIEAMLYNYFFDKEDTYIINPMKYLDSLPDSISYIEKTIIAVSMLSTADSLLLDDTGSWLNSTGVRVELANAYSNNKTIMYLSILLQDINNMMIVEDMEEVNNDE